MTAEQLDIITSLEERILSLACKWNPTDIDISNIAQLKLIIEQLEVIWN